MMRKKRECNEFSNEYLDEMNKAGIDAILCPGSITPAPDKASKVPSVLNWKSIVVELEWNLIAGFHSRLSSRGERRLHCMEPPQFSGRGPTCH